MSHMISKLSAKIEEIENTGIRYNDWIAMQFNLRTNIIIPTEEYFERYLPNVLADMKSKGYVINSNSAFGIGTHDYRSPIVREFSPYSFEGYLSDGMFRDDSFKATREFFAKELIGLIRRDINCAGEYINHEDVTIVFRNVPEIFDRISGTKSYSESWS